MRAAQIAQHAADLPRATAFYTALLGAGPVATFDPPGLVFFDLDGQRLLLDRGAPSALHYFLVDDIEAALTRLRAAGAEVESDPTPSSPTTTTASARPAPTRSRPSSATPRTT